MGILPALGRLSWTLAFATTLAACPSPAPEPDADSGPGDGQPGPGDLKGSDGEPDPGDGTPSDQGSDDRCRGDLDPADRGPDDGPFQEFEVRVPQSRTLTCSSGLPYTGSFVDVDHVCRIDNCYFSGQVYVQATPVDCMETTGAFPTAFAVDAYARVGGVVTAISATYDWGGNHHNDQLQLAVGGQYFVLWHSSVGWGWRACAPPDCMLTCPTGATFTTCDRYGGYALDGCDRVTGGPPPPLPVICVRVRADGSVPPLVDPWQRPEGAPLLPCVGDQMP